MLSVKKNPNVTTVQGVYKKCINTIFCFNFMIIKEKFVLKMKFIANIWIPVTLILIKDQNCQLITRQEYLYVVSYLNYKKSIEDKQRPFYVLKLDIKSISRVRQNFFYFYECEARVEMLGNFHMSKKKCIYIRLKSLNGLLVTFSWSFGHV